MRRAHTPHNPSRPSPTGDCIGRALARPPLRRHNEVIRGEGGSLSGTRANVDSHQVDLRPTELLTPCAECVLESGG